MKCTIKILVVLIKHSTNVLFICFEAYFAEKCAMIVVRLLGCCDVVCSYYFISTLVCIVLFCLIASYKCKTKNNYEPFVCKCNECMCHCVVCWLNVKECTHVITNRMTYYIDAKNKRKISYTYFVRSFKFMTLG